MKKAGFSAVLISSILISSTLISSVSHAGRIQDAWNSIYSRFTGKSSQTAVATNSATDGSASTRLRDSRSTNFNNLSELVVSRDAIKTLSPSVQSWLRSETVLLSRSVDSTRLQSPEQNSQNPLFAPEAGNVFQLHGYWVDRSELQSQTSDVPQALRELLIRQHEGREQILFFVHPESRGFYSSKFDFDKLENEVFLATSTASSRSLLVWKPGHENSPFVAKVSLNAVIGGTERTIKGTEGAMSIGTDQILRGAVDLPAQFSTFREEIGATPLGMERGAMIIREIPHDMITGERHFIPLFALYAKPADGTEPLLLQMLQTSQESADDFVKHRIVEPFVDEWFKLAIDNGVLMESHAQNVLIELGNRGFPVGHFRHRDFGGFNVDLNFRKAQGLYVPKNLPTFTGSVEKDYHQSSHAQNVFFSLNNYFDAGFLFNVEKSIIEWSQAGLIKNSNVREGALREMVLNRVREHLQVELGDLSHITMDYRAIETLLPKAQAKRIENIRARGGRCPIVFGG